ncbi:MAG: hypothetical protein ABW146_08485 [Candidatus Sedimenticola sp. 6PFRAG7]
MSDQFYKSQTICIFFHYIFKIIPMLISGMSIYLGYKLYILGVTGEASLVVDAKELKAQLINAAPGLFFAIGGLASLIFSIYKGAKVTLPAPNEINGQT